MGNGADERRTWTRAGHDELYARERLAEGEFDAVLPDLGLQDSSGLETLEAGRKSAPRVPIVVMTNSSDDEWMTEAARQGIQDYLVNAHLSAPLLAHSLHYAVERHQLLVELEQKTDALRSSEDRYRSFVAQSSEGIWRLELEQPLPTELPEDELIEHLYRYGYVAECNDSLARMCGHTQADSIIGMRLGDFIPPTDRRNTELLCAFIRNGYRSDDVIWDRVDEQGEREYILNHMVGILEDGMLVRVWGTQRDITALKAAEDALLDHQARLRSLAAELSRTEERERRRVAVELHDTIAQTLATVRVRLALVAESSPRAEVLSHLKDLVDAAIQQTRAIIVQLSPPSLCDLGLTHAVEWLAEQLHREYGLTVVCQDDGQEKPLGEDLKAFLFHATRELLVNTAKHSQAESAHVSLCRDGDSVRVTVADAGRGFDPRKALARVSQGEAFGLFSIRERVGQWPGGRLEIQSAPGEGTHASLIVPLTP